MVPEIRVAMVRDFLDLLRDGRVPRGDDILARADADLLRSVAEQSRLAWIPAAPVARLSDEGLAVLGAAGWRALQRRAAGDLAERPLFRAFIRGAHAVFGATPGTFCKLFPRVLAQAHRNYGPIEVDALDGHQSLLRFDDCEPEGLSLGLLEVFAGTIEGLVASSAPSVHTDIEYVAGSRRASIAVRW